MMTGIGGNSKYITVNNSSSNIPYVSPNSNNPATGMIRVNGTNFEVYNGSTWMMIGGSYPIIDISERTKEILIWAEAKMELERKVMEEAVNNPTVADALASYQDAADKLAVIMQLVQQQDPQNL